MKSINLTNKLKFTNWQYLPDKYALCQYLTRADIIELSKSNKNYRMQLTPEVFKKLRLIKCFTILPDKERYKSLDREKSLEVMLNLLKEVLGNKLRFVKEVTLDDSFNNKFAKLFVDLLPKITKLKIGHWREKGSLLALSTIFCCLEHLEFVELFQIGFVHLHFDSDKVVFPKSLKSLRFTASYIEHIPKQIIDNIDSSYSNLISISIASKNMINNLPFTMPNLKELIILDYYEMDQSLIVDFIKKNPQIIKLTTQFGQMESNLYDAILTLECLNDLSINGSRLSIMLAEADNFPINYSIKRLKIGRFYNVETALKLINSFKSIETVEFESTSFMYDSVNWDILDSKINITNVLSYDINSHKIKALDSLQFFNQVNFVSQKGFEDVINDLKKDKLNNYSLILPITGNTKSFSLKKLH